MSLPENIREARLQAGLSQEQVAEALEVSRQAVSRWERGASRLSTANLVALATLFHRSVEQLTGRCASTPQVEEGTKRICDRCGRRAVFYGDPGRESAFCSEDCRAAYGREMAGIQKHLKWFWAGVIAACVLMVGGSFFKAVFPANCTVGGGMALLGATLVLFPFCTPQTYAKLGLRRASILGRVLGCAVELYGLYILFWG